MHRENLDFFGKSPVDDSVALENDLSDVLTSNLWDQTPRIRELSKALRGSEHAFRKQLGIPRGVTSYEKTNSIQIAQRLIGPGYLSHRTIRWRASS
jgi:hypothetical protein